MLCISAAYAVMRCLCVCLCMCLSRSCIASKRIKISSVFSTSSSHTILVFPHQTGWQYSDGNPSNGGIECRWSKQKPRFWAYLALVPAVSAATCQVLSTRSPVDDGHRFAGSKRRCWLWEKTTKCLWQEASTLRQRQQTVHLTARSDKSVAYIINNKRLYSTFCTVEANYWQIRSIARPLCDSRATC